ncbi:DUF2000 domain-containing protein [Paludibacterium purpuratum]|uniref:DUF2000 domain-containing protein n=1 Tax=Paludibacterium purpuratum TaxID=1144873 RepID=A0A4R7BER7_9NEIS|nr:DUF2000 domain-containing protein [Paludibacterium purpuratum]TDR82762.1 hypothetical protein DFP86_101151 [Paludibacterium purpuratum]
MSDLKCAIVLDPRLPTGILANTAAVLSLSLGKAHPTWIGEDLVDGQGQPHRGITTRPIPVLQASTEQLQQLRQDARPHEAELTVIDLIDATLSTRSYQAYAEAMASTPADALRYHGLALLGPKKLVNKLTDRLGLLR